MFHVSSRVSVRTWHADIISTANVSGNHLFDVVLEYKIRNFLEILSGNVLVFIALGLTVDTCSRQLTRPCFLRGRQAHDAQHHGRHDQKDSYRRYSTGAVLGPRCRARCATTGFWSRQCSTFVLTTSGTVGLRVEQIRLQEYVDRTWRTERLLLLLRGEHCRCVISSFLVLTCSSTACRLWLLAVPQLPVPIAIGQARPRLALTRLVF